MTVTEIVDAIVKFGVTPVALGTAIVLLFLMFKAFNENNRKQLIFNEEQRKSNQEQSRLLTEVFQTMVNINKDTHHGHSHDEEEENRKVNEKINKQLRKLLEHANANRVCCFLYHNGGYSINGRSFQKMSMMFEQVDEYTITVMKEFQNMPRSMYSVLIENVAKQGYYYIKNIKDIEKIDAVTYQSFKARGVKAAYIIGIKDTDDTNLGFISVEYSINLCENEEDLKRRLLDKALMISGLMQGNNAEDPTKITERGECSHD